MSHLSPPSNSPLAASTPQSAATSWEILYRAAVREQEKLRAQLDETTKDRDAYRAALQALLPINEVSFTKEEVFASLGQRPPLCEFIADLEKQLLAQG